MKSETNQAQDNQLTERAMKFREVFERNGSRPFKFSDEQKIRNKDYVIRLALKVRDSFDG